MDMHPNEAFVIVTLIGECYISLNLRKPDSIFLRLAIWILFSHSAFTWGNCPCGIIVLLWFNKVLSIWIFWKFPCCLGSQRHRHFLSALLFAVQACLGMGLCVWERERERDRDREFLMHFMNFIVESIKTQ